jgi:hypothetical protein
MFNRTVVRSFVWSGWQFACAAAAAILAPAFAPAAAAETAYAVTASNALIRFETGTPGAVTTIGPITGLQPAEQIAAMDFRPANARLYAVGSSNRLYFIDPATGAATAVNSNPLSVILAGGVSMDFDPVQDRIRIVTSTNQNLLVDPDTAALTTQTPITTSSGTVAVTAIAYTNNFDGADRSTLLGIDSINDRFVVIGGVEPTDGGASQAGGTAAPFSNALGVDTDTLSGLDVIANAGIGYFTIGAAGDPQSTLYRFVTGNPSVTPTIVGPVGAGERVRALAVFSQAVTLWGIREGHLISFLSTVVKSAGAPLFSNTPLLGLNAEESVRCIDVRPANSLLYGITNQNRLLTIDTGTGQVSAVGMVGSLAGLPDACDFDPVADRLRVITDSEQNIVINPADATAVVQTSPTRIISALGYTNSIAGAATTTLYGIEDAIRTLVTFADPPTGVATSIGVPSLPHTFLPQPMDISPLDNTAFVSTMPSAAARNYSEISVIDLQTGDVFTQSQIVTGVINALAVASAGAFALSVSNYTVLENAGSALVTVRRLHGSSGPATVTLTAAAGSASGADFVPSSSPVFFGSGETTKTVFVAITDDALAETDETIALTLSAPSAGARLDTLVNGTITITANDQAGGGGAAPTVIITDPTTAPTYTASSLFLTLGGNAADSDGTVATIDWFSDRGFSGSIASNLSAASIDWIANDVGLAPGVNTVTVVATDDDGNQKSDTIVVTVDSLTYYLAEGATGGFFDLDLLLANPNSSPVGVNVTFLKPLGQGTVQRQYTLAPTSRRTISVETIPGMENAEVSTIVTGPATLPVVVERTMRWDASGYGAHTDKASAGASTRWYFAEGSQGFFFTYLLLANPQNAANEATVRYLREGGEAPLTRTYPLQALERFTVDIGQDAGLVGRSFGIEVTFQQPGVAERAMYFGTGPMFWVGGHESAGATHASRSWLLAEGATGPFFETFVLLANPNLLPATAQVRYLPSFGSPVDKTYTVPPGARVTINIEGEDASLANAAVATQVTSDVPILVERTQYWPDPASTWYEAHNSFGVTALGQRWGLAEGRSGGALSYETYILLANPNPSVVNVSIQFLREDGTTVTKNFPVDPQSRRNVQVNVEAPELAGSSFGAVVTATQPIAVERAMYNNANGVVWQAGTNATATPLPVLVP